MSNCVSCTSLRVRLAMCIVCCARNRLAPWGWSKKIETCWSNFKCFNVKKFYVCALVGVLIEWFYEMHGARMKIQSWSWYCVILSSFVLWHCFFFFFFDAPQYKDVTQFAYWLCISRLNNSVVWKCHDKTISPSIYTKWRWAPFCSTVMACNKPLCSKNFLQNIQVH